MPYTLITGSTGVLGKAFCMQFAKRGNNLFLSGRSKEKLQKLKDEITLSYPNIKIDFFPCDLQNKEDRESTFAYIDNCGYEIDRLVNVAGADVQKPFLEYDQQKVAFQIRATFEGAVSMTLYALSKFKAKGEVLTVSSMSGTTPMPYFALYSACKGALTSFMKSIRYEVKNKGIKVVTVAPGAIPTREDIKEDIKKQGLTGKLSCKSVDYVVEKSLKALKKNKAFTVPGFFNKLVYFLTKITPSKIQMKVVEKKFKNKTKDAF